MLLHWRVTSFLHTHTYIFTKFLFLLFSTKLQMSLELHILTHIPSYPGLSSAYPSLTNCSPHPTPCCYKHAPSPAHPFLSLQLSMFICFCTYVYRHIYTTGLCILCTCFCKFGYKSAYLFHDGKAAYFMCVSGYYFSVADIQHHNLGNLEKQWLIGACGSRERDGNRLLGQEVEKSHLQP